MKATRIPVWLLTGYLGSGKTTLLQSWLRDPSLQDAALIVNEIGEVGMDDRLLDRAVDSASLLSSACICCTGLSGLQEALETLWWDRLHRRRLAYGSVVIETTGLADPRPVIEAFDAIALLRERYQLAGVFTAVGAVAGLNLIESHPEALAQVHCADAIIVTKCDRADGVGLARALHALQPHAGIALSQHASLDWPSARAMAIAAHSGHDSGATPSPAWQVKVPNGHSASTQFVPLASPLTRAALEDRVEALKSDALLRIKGVVRLDDGALRDVQWAIGDGAITVTPFSGEAPALGLTCIQQNGGAAGPAEHPRFVF